MPESITGIDLDAFCASPNQNIYFDGNAPGISEYDGEIGFSFDLSDTLYYYPDRTGWTDSAAYDPVTATWNGYTLVPRNGTLPVKITTLYPGNNALYDFDYPEDGSDHTYYRDGKPRIFFNRELLSFGGSPKLDFSKGTLKIHRASDDAVVYEVTESTINPGTSTGIALWGSQAPYQAVRLEGVTTILENETEYYVTVPEGFFQFKNGTKSPAIQRGSWQFTTAHFHKKGQFKYQSAFTNNKERYPYEYDERWFRASGYQYQQELARMTIRMAMAAAAEKPDYIQDLYTQLGFTFTRNSISYPTPETDSIGYAIGHKTIREQDGSEAILMAVAVRGGGYGREWSGNFNVDKTPIHRGFDTASEQVLKAVREYIKELNPQKPVKIWMTGYSRAAATSNLVADKINDGRLNHPIDAENLYVYTFETPQNTCEPENHPYIHNIINPIDPVPKVAPYNSLLHRGWDYKRNGCDYWLPCLGITKDYYQLKGNMIEELKNIQNASSAKNFTPPKQLEIQHKLLDSVVLGLTSIISRDKYVDKYQSALTASFDNIKGEFDFKVAMETFLKENPEVLLKIGKEIYKGAQGKSVAANAVLFIVSEQAGEQLIHVAFPEETATTYEVVKEVGDIIIQAHYPEICLAWMDSLPNNAFGNGPTTYGDASRTVLIQCPVDVDVYNSRNQLVAQFIDDEPQKIENSDVISYLDVDGNRTLIMPGNEEYRVEVNATGNGKLTYLVTENSISSDTPQRIVSYQGINIQTGDAMQGIIENLDTSSEASYPFTKNSEELKPTVNQSGAEVQYHTITIHTEGDGTAIGDGNYVDGKITKLKAVPAEGKCFVGWYENEALISSKREYRLTVNGDHHFIAKFANDDHNRPNGGGGDGGGSSRPSKPVKPAVPEPEELYFTDVHSEDYFFDSVKWAVDQNITLGLTDSTFAPYASCTRAQMVTFLWRAAGCPEPNSSTMIFTDVSADAYYAKAILWAVEQDITKGVTETTFQPNATVTRAQTVTFLWRVAGFPTVGVADFTDVSSDAYYAEAVAWAEQNGITKGVTENMFQPNANCTRGQIVTFLYRFYL